MVDARTDELEIKLAFLERQVEALDEVARANSDEITELKRTVQRLQARLEQGRLDSSDEDS
ncbi:MAG: SlyX family protein [Planctomycetota bacterium]